MALRISEQGFGLNLQLSDFTFNNLQKTFEQMLSNQNLSKRVNLLKLSFKNQQNPSLDTAVWWIENLLENPRTNEYLFELKKTTLGLFSRNSFDIILLFEILILICIINMILVCRQTIQNFKKLSKAKKKTAEKKEEKLKKLKKEKKEKKDKAKTS